VTTNYITGLEMVWVDGERARLGGRALDYPGLDLVGLMTGSEGTLGVVTEASVLLKRDPPAVKTLLAAFDSVEAAGDAVSAVIAAGLVPATMEMMGQRMMQVIEEYNHPGLPTEAGAALIIDVDGYPASVDPQIREVEAVLSEHGATELRVAQSAAERDQIWLARKSAAGAMARVAVDHYTVDGSVPRSKLAETLRGVIEICEELDLEVLFLLHAGDGNLHPLVLVPEHDNREFLERLHEGGRRMSELFVAQGGTISGEHGIGIEKQEFMPLMFSDEELSAMREIKELFDPEELLNPQKVFPKVMPPHVCKLLEPEEGIDLSSDAVEPRSADVAAQAVCALTSAERPVRVKGGGTKSTLFPTDGVTLSTQGLAGVRTYARDDLYVTAGAGTTLQELQAALAGDDMWVPIVSPWPEATVGGIVATAFNAPLRMRYGSVRDLVLALKAVLPDGREIHAGRPVMKNVAGYDLAKLFIGSYGTLGLITDVTFRISARPRLVRSLAVPVNTVVEGLAWGERLAKEALVASAVLLAQKADVPALGSDLALVYTAEGLQEDVDAELAEVRDMLRLAGAPQPVALETSGNAVWADWMGRGLIEGERHLVRVGVPPKDVSALVRGLVPELAGAGMILDFANGHAYLRGAVDLAQIRSAAARYEGYAVVQRSRQPDVDVWGYEPGGLAQMRRIKATWDMFDVFNPGIFVYDR
jgi:D-lactate dehydrogenase (cytochrome)